MTISPIRLTPDRYLQTPICHFVHPTTGRHVTLVALAHEGEPRYYRQIIGLVAELTSQGAICHAEGTNLPELAANPPADATAAERELLRLAAPPGPSQSVTAVPGWVAQGQGLGGMPDGWQRHDLTELEIMRLIGPDLWRALEIGPPAAPARSWVPRRVRTLRERTLKVLSLVGATKGYRQPSPTDPIYLEHRNQVALKGVDDTPGNLVLVWGFGHLPGLAEGLQQRGYTLLDTQWQTVGRISTVRLVAGSLLIIVPRLVRTRLRGRSR